MARNQNDPFADDAYDDTDSWMDDRGTDSWMEDSDWLGDEPTNAAPSPEPNPAPPQNNGRTVIPADDSLEDDSLDEEDFGDITPRPTRFTPLSPEEVFHSDAQPERRRTADEEETLTPAEIRAKKREERQAAKAERRAAKEEIRKRRREEREEKKAAKKAAAAPEDNDDAPAGDHDDDSESTAVTPGPSKQRSKRNSQIGVAATFIGLLALVGGGGYLLSQSLSSDDSQDIAAEDTEGAEENADARADSPLANPTTSDIADSDVESSQDDDKITKAIEGACKKADASSRKGDKESGENAIYGFNHAYFSERDADTAADYLADHMYDTIDTLQAGIDDPRNGDDYCLTVKPGEKDNEFEVTLMEFNRPDEGETKIESWRTEQIVTVEDTDDGWEITAQHVK